MTYIRVNATHAAEETSEPDPDDEWDRADTRTTWDFNGISVVGDKDYWDLAVDYDVVPGKTYYLVVVVYHSGGGNDECAYAEYVDLYQDSAVAESVAEEIRKHDDGMCRWTDSKSYDLKLENHKGKVKPYYASWQGYFNSIGHIEVLPVQITEQKKRF